MSPLMNEINPYISISPPIDGIWDVEFEVLNVGLFD